MREAVAGLGLGPGPKDDALVGPVGLACRAGAALAGGEKEVEEEEELLLLLLPSLIGGAEEFEGAALEGEFCVCVL